MTHNHTTTILAALLIATLITSCTGGTKNDTVKIGAALPMTGDVASLGQGSKAAVQHAVDEINANGGINGKKVKVYFEDTRCKPQAATKAVNKLLNVNDVTAIIGGLCSSNTLAVAPIAERSNTVLFSPCSSAPEITHAGDYVFRAYPSDIEQGKAAVTMAGQMNATSAAILSCKNDYCQGLHDVFKQEFQKRGTIVAEESFAQGSADLRTQLSKIRAEQPDIIYFPSYPESAAAGLKQMNELDIDTPVLGAGTWSDQSLIEGAGDAAEGVLFTKPYTPQPETFKSYILNETGLNNVPVCTAQAYDVMHILAEKMRQVGTDSQRLKDSLYNVTGYEGVSGNITLDENGDLAASKYVVRTVQDGEFTDHTII